jgi:hypothetical protein
MGFEPLSNGENRPEFIDIILKQIKPMILPPFMLQVLLLSLYFLSEHCNAPAILIAFQKLYLYRNLERLLYIPKLILVDVYSFIARH